jgi:hypothetical protein
MQIFDAIERAVDAIMLRAPHMSKDFRRGMARNLWWVVAMFVGFATIYAIYLLFVTVIWRLDLGQVAGLPLAYIDAALLAIVAVVGGLSVRNLRRQTILGWRGLFVMWLFLTLIVVANLAANFSRGEAIWAALTVVFLAYAIYEPKDFFRTKPKSARRKS